MGTLATEIAANLSNTERKSQLALVLDHIARKRDGVIKTERLGRCIGGFFGFDDAINLLLGITTSLGKKDLVSVDSWSLDMLETVQTIGLLDFIFDIVKNSLRRRQELLHARKRCGVDFLHIYIIPQSKNRPKRRVI